MEQEISAVATQVLALITSRGLSSNDFYKSLLPKHFSALAEKKYNLKFDLVWQNNIETTPFYTKTTSGSIAQKNRCFTPRFSGGVSQHKTSGLSLALPSEY